MTIEETVQHCNDLLDVLPAEALAKAREYDPDLGGFAVFPVYAPLEIIHAAGLMPVGLFGVGNQIEISHADSRFQSFICSIAKSTLELFLRDEMKEFSGVVFSSICDVARNLSSLVKRNAPDQYVEYLHLPQNLYNKHSVTYIRAEFERFRTNLSRHIQRPINDDAIAHSIEIYNKARRLVRELYAARQQRPGSITASELYAVLQAGTRMMPETFVTLLEGLSACVLKRTVHPRDSVTVVVEGAFCELPPVGFLDVIESAGCQIKDDDLMIGWRMFSQDVRSNGDPIAALSDAYLRQRVYSSVCHDRDKPRSEQLIQRLGDAGAEAVIFSPAKFCEPALLDYVLFRQKLEDANIPHLKLEFEEKMWTFDSARTEVETFAESMLFD